MKSLLGIILISFLTINSSHTKMDNKYPELGDPMPCTPQDKIQYLISSAQMSPGCKIISNGIVFFVASTQDKKICYISTDDSRFNTPEGIHVGCKYSEVLKAKGSTIIEEDGWGSYSKLPSGWRAIYRYTFGHSKLFEISKDSVVSGLFKR